MTTITTMRAFTARDFDRWADASTAHDQAARLPMLAPVHEPSEDLNFILCDAAGQPRDVFTFYGPFSAGLELAGQRAELYDAAEIAVYSALNAPAGQ